jgi:restriction system-associated AAA family ATPase
MRINRVKILSRFRGLPAGYEVIFNPTSENGHMLEPICFVGLNGSGKSNVLEVIAEIFYYLETYHKAQKKDLHKFKKGFGFEIEYYLPRITFEMARGPWEELTELWDKTKQAPLLRIIKQREKYPVISACFGDREIFLKNKDSNRNEAILPRRIIAYSSGMNELISNPFIKIDFHYFDEFQEKSGESDYSGLEMNRLFFMDYDSNKPISVCNFLFDEASFDQSQFESIASSATDFGGIYLNPLKEELKIEDIKTFSIKLSLRDGYNAPLDLPSELFLAVDKLKKCATFCEESSKETTKGKYITYDLFYWVNRETKEAFHAYFKTAFDLYRQLYFLRLLNIYLLGKELRNKVKSAEVSTNLSAMLPKLEEEQLVFSINNIAFVKENANEKIYYKQLSDGEHQLLQVLGTLMLMDAPGTLFILDEPETHYNPEWRSKFVSLLNNSVTKKPREQEIILTSHSPFIVSDCKPSKVFIFSRDNRGNVIPAFQPTINTFGTSVSILTEEIFGKRESISDLSYHEIERIKKLPLNSFDDIQAAKNESRSLGESAEKVLLFRQLIMREDELRKNA